MTCKLVIYIFSKFHFVNDHVRGRLVRMAYDRSPTYPVFASSALRQRGSGIGPLVAGVSSIVIPLATKYALPLGKEFVKHAIPEILDVFSGKKKAKAAFKSAAIKTAKKQLGAGRRRKKSSAKKKTTKKPKRSSYRGKKKKTTKRKTRKTTARKSTKKRQSRAKGKRIASNRKSFFRNVVSTEPF